METVYLDTETTGLKPGYDEILEIAIVDDAGEALINTLVKPEKRVRWPSAQKVHGIKPTQVAPFRKLKTILPQIEDAVRGKRLVIYNADYDLRFFENNLNMAADHWCAMLCFSNFRKVPSHHKNGGEKHRALSDALACRAVWQWLLENDKESQPPSFWSMITGWFR
jgi:DNA polymerase III epsilon subunit-like protein